MGSKAIESTEIDRRAGELLHARSVELGISLGQLEKLTGQSKSQLSKRFRGLRHFPLSEFVDVCKALSLDPAKVMNEIQELVFPKAKVTPLPAPEPEPYIPPHRRPGFSPEQVAAKKAWQDNAEHIDSI